MYPESYDSISSLDDGNCSKKRNGLVDYTVAGALEPVARNRLHSLLTKVQPTSPTHDTTIETQAAARSEEKSLWMLFNGTRGRE